MINSYFCTKLGGARKGPRKIVEGAYNLPFKLLISNNKHITYNISLQAFCFSTKLEFRRRKNTEQSGEPKLANCICSCLLTSLQSMAVLDKILYVQEQIYICVHVCNSADKVNRFLILGIKDLGQALVISKYQIKKLGYEMAPGPFCGNL